MVRRDIYIVAYDTPCNKRRANFVKLLQKFGGRRQNKSVFELLIKTLEFKQLKSELNKMIRDNEDVILIYPICKSCFSKSITVGTEQTESSTIIL